MARPKKKKEPEFDLHDPSLYINRELSWLAFNKRVLELAKDETVPLLERLRFLCIFSTNLDEFFEIRVAGLKAQIRSNEPLSIGPDRTRPTELFNQIATTTHGLVEEQYRVLNDVLTPALAKQGIEFSRRSDWGKDKKAWVREYFESQVLPVLSPVGLDPSHPFPRVLNKSLNFIVSVSGKDAYGRHSGTAIVQAPRSLPRVIPIPSEIAECKHDFVFLSSVIHAHVGTLFPGMKVKGCYQFRVTRNSDLFVDEEAMTDLSIALETELLERRFGDAVRLEVADNCSHDVAHFLLNQFQLESTDLYQVNGPVNLNRLLQIPQLVAEPSLLYKPFVPATPPQLQPNVDHFAAIRQTDVLMHHPYDSFSPVIEFLRAAANDPSVLGIKITLYRTDADSLLSKALVEAARNGKEVTIVIELRARFDEEENIELASQLRDVGAHVVYGVVGFKTHAKLMLVVRREDSEIRRYAHLSTGNYHPATARIYTDFGLFTCDPKICADVNDLFMNLTGLGKARTLRKLKQSPFSLLDAVIGFIHRETKNASEGKPARIAAKMNSLTEPTVIRALYEASQAGVQIDLIVRGICSLKPGVKGISDNITVRSILGRFLEHSRVWWFENNEDPECYLTSADWMVRNLFRRVEHAVPVEKKKLRKRIYREAFEVGLEDNAGAWKLKNSGEYDRIRPKKNEARLSSQELLLAEITDTP